MKKFALLLGVVGAILFLMVLAVGVQAAGGSGADVPAPYAGLKNPFSWKDTSAQQAGKRVYQRSCGGCHGDNGSSIPASDFSTPNYARSLEEKPDFYFWRLSEGNLNNGMPPFKASLSEEQRWQLLTYLWSLGATPAKAAPSLEEFPVGVPNSTLLLTAQKRAQPGQTLTLTATLRDSQNKPIDSTPVKFFIKKNFFANGLMEIGEVITNEQGIAILEYVPREAGDVEIVARYQDKETSTTLNLAQPDEPFYQAEAGLRLPSLLIGRNVFVGSLSNHDREETVNAPTGSFRLPVGIFSWILLVVATVMLIWTTYFRVIYQVFRIPIAKEIRDTNTRLVPLVAMAFVAGFGILLVLVLVHGPYSHLHLSP